MVSKPSIAAALAIGPAVAVHRRRACAWNGGPMVVWVGVREWAKGEDSAIGDSCLLAGLLACLCTNGGEESMRMRERLGEGGSVSRDTWTGSDHGNTVGSGYQL